jgi:hypothetical protein
MKDQADGECSTIWKKENAYKSLKEGDHLKELDIDGRIMIRMRCGPDSSGTGQ